MIVYKPAGKRLPSEDLIRHLWQRNSDGGGFCYPQNGKVVGIKGIMKVKEFIDEMRNYLNRNDPAILHFRVATHGEKTGACTHPFPASTNTNELRKYHWECEYGVAHNGTIVGYGERTGKLSDTQDFIKKILHDRLVLLGLFSDKHCDAVSELVFGEIGQSRLAIMRGDGKVLMMGTWYKHDGYDFSNESFRRYGNNDKDESDEKEDKKDDKKDNNKGSAPNVYDNDKDWKNRGPNKAEKTEEREALPGISSGIDLGNKGTKQKGKKNKGSRAKKHDDGDEDGEYECPNCHKMVHRIQYIKGHGYCIYCAGDAVEKIVDRGRGGEEEDSFKDFIPDTDILTPSQIYGGARKGGRKEMTPTEISLQMLENGYKFCHRFGIWVLMSSFCEFCKNLAVSDKDVVICSEVDRIATTRPNELYTSTEAIECPVLFDDRVTLIDTGKTDMFTEDALEIYESLFDFSNGGTD